MRQFLAVAVVLAACAVPVTAQDKLAQEAKELAKDMASQLRKGGVKEVALSQPVKWADGRAVSAGPGVIDALADALSRDGFTVTAVAQVKAAVRLDVETDRVTGQPAVAMSVQVSLNGKDRDIGRRLVFGEDVLARLCSPTATLKPGTPERDRATLLVTPLVTHEAKAPPVPDGPFRVELLVRDSDGTFRVRKPEGGQVKFTELEQYYIRLVSDADFESVVCLTIDGLFWDTYADPSGVPQVTGRLLLLPPKGNTVVKGFYKSPTASYAFDVMELPVLSAAKKSPTEPGVITATFRPAWKKGETPVAGEEREAHHRAGLNTVPVRELEDSFTTTERLYGRIRGVVSVKYGK